MKKEKKNLYILKNMLLLVALLLTPFFIAFGSTNLGTSLITLFLAGEVTFTIKAVSNSIKSAKEEKDLSKEEKNINRDLWKSLFLGIVSSLMIVLVLIKFLSSDSMSVWWSEWYTRQAMVIWWVVIEFTSVVSLFFIAVAISRKTSFVANKNVKKIFSKISKALSKAIKAFIDFFRIRLEVISKAIVKLLISVEEHISKKINESNIEESIFKDSILVTRKKATLPPLF